MYWPGKGKSKCKGGGTGFRPKVRTIVTAKFWSKTMQ